MLAMLARAAPAASPMQPPGTIQLATATPSLQGAKAQPLKPVPRTLRGLPGTLRLDLSSGVPVIEAKIGEEALKLVVDTGAAWSLLRPDAAKRLALPTREAEELKARDAAGELRGVDAAHVETLVLETISNESATGKPIELGDFDLIVMESPVVEAAGADGILGLPLFRRMVARFDFAAGELELGGKSLAQSDDGRTLSVEASEGGLVAIEGSFVPVGGEAAPEASGGAARNLVIDTGFSGFLHLPEALAGLLASKAPGRCGGVTATAHRERDFERVPLERDLLIGRYRLVRPIASVLPGAEAAGAVAIGTGVLRHFTVTLDLPRRRVRLEAPDDVVQLEEKRRLQPGSDDVPSGR